jgi:signal peptidase I
LPKVAFLGVTLGSLIYQQPYRTAFVYGLSMTPTLSDNSIVLMTTNFDPDKIRRDDVVVFTHHGERYIKRIAYLESDRLEQIKLRGPRTIWVSIFYPQPTRFRYVDIRYFSIPKGYVYVLSDNVSCDTDSRELGPIALSEIEGIVLHPGRNPNLPETNASGKTASVESRADGNG